MSGARLLGAERMVVQSFRAEPAQLRKFAALGGGAWVRERIHCAPRGSKAVTAHPSAGDNLVTQSFRAEPAQLRRFKALGGSAWLRATLDATPWPRGTKVAR
jgi:hypothetical protein